ncbi:MAG TPA: hypothetical protein VI423_10945 [Paenisporosarcina sp.]|nr:hypothetical protein [Paenisporosarcina sp.]
MTNLNNGIELKIVLGINDTASKTSLNTQIAELEQKLNKVKIDVKIDPKAVVALEKLATMDFSKLSQQIDSVGKETAKMATATAKELEVAMKKAAEITGVELGKAIRGSAEDIDYITKKLAGTNAKIKVDFDTVNGEKQLKKLQTSIEDKGITTKITYEKVSVMGDDNISKDLWMPKLFQETNAQLSNAVKNTDELIAKMNKLQTEGKITNQQFEILTSSIGKISGSTGLNRANQMMDEMVATTKKVNANLVERDQIEKRLVTNQQKIQTQILSAEKAMKSNPSLGKSQEAKGLLESYQKLNPASKNFKDNLFEVNTQFTRMKTAASEASRESMGMMSMFKTAMEKFPIEFRWE